MRSLSASRWFASKLEEGAFRSPAARWASGVWARLAEPVRPVELPSGAFVVGVGGAVLGGSGKSPVCAALAAALKSSGLRVAIVASSYGARAPAPQEVSPHDSAAAVGDEALALSRALRDVRVSVFSGPSRAQTLALARAAGADVIFVDGLLQARPQRLGLSVLVLDGEAPWGAERCPPAGDLRARRARLLDAADVVLVREELAASERAALAAAGKPVHTWSSRLIGARSRQGRLLAPSELRGLRLGLVLAVARPERVERELLRAGIEPRLVRLCGDHARPRAGLRVRARRLAGAPLDAWLTTPKCATKLGSSFEGAPILSLEQGAAVPPDLVEICAQKGRRRARSSAGISGRSPW